MALPRLRPLPDDLQVGGRDWVRQVLVDGRVGDAARPDPVRTGYIEPTLGCSGGVCHRQFGGLLAVVSTFGCTGLPEALPFAQLHRYSGDLSSVSPR